MTFVGDSPPRFCFDPPLNGSKARGSVNIVLIGDTLPGVREFGSSGVREFGSSGVSRVRELGIRCSESGSGRGSRSGRAFGRWLPGAGAGGVSRKTAFV
jgi:hypothetical protein